MIKRILFILTLLAMQCSIIPQANAAVPGYTSWNDYVRNTYSCDTAPNTVCENFTEGKIIYFIVWGECINWSGDMCTALKSHWRYSNNPYSLLTILEGSINATFGKTYGNTSYVPDSIDPNTNGLSYKTYNDKGVFTGGGTISALNLQQCQGFIKGYGCPNKTGENKLERTPTKDCPKNICSKEGNPFDVRTGAKVESVIDLTFPLILQRNYSSTAKYPGIFGSKWKSNFDKRMTFIAVDSKLVGISLITPEDDIISFNSVDGINFTQNYNDNIQYKIVVNLSTIDVFKPDLTKETYEINSGRILSENYKGKTLTYKYDSNGNLFKVTDHTGKYLQFNIDNNFRLVNQILASNGDFLDYQYINSNVSLVKLNGKTQIGYSYSGSLLTGKFDGNNIQYASFTYDSLGRGIENKYMTNDGRDVNKYTFSYPYDNQTVVTQDNGYSKKFYMDTMNYQKKITSMNFNGFTETTNFDNDGNVTQKSDLNGVYENYTYDNLGRILTHSRDGKQVSLTWYGNVNLVSNMSENSANGTRTTDYSYDVFYNLINKTVTTSTGESLAFKSTYNNKGNLVTQTMPNGLVTNYTYKNIDNSNTSGLLASISTNSGQSIVINSYDSRGNITSITVNGLTKTMTYDYKGRILTESVNGATNTYTYDISGNMLTSQMADGYLLTMTYDTANRLLSISDNMGGNATFIPDDYTNEVLTTSINQNNNLVIQRNKVIDSLRRITETFNATSRTKQTNNYYNYIDKPNSTTDANGNNTNYGFNSRNDMTNYSFGLDTVSKQYDIDSNQTSINVSYQQTTMNYDDFGRITQLNSPDTGIHNYTYDTANRRDTHTDAKGIVHTTISDLNNNPVTMSHVGNGVTQTENYTYNNNGSLMTMIDNSGSTTMIRNNLDQIMKKTVVIGGKTLIVQYGYNTIGQLVNMTYPSGLVIQYGYTNGFLTSISSSGNNIVNNISYNSMLKEPVSYVLGGNIVTIDKDTDGLLTGFVDSGTFNQTITTDNMGHVLSLIDSSSNDDFNIMLTPNYEVQSGTMNGKNLSYNIGPNHNLFVQNDGITNINYNPSYYHNKIASLNDNMSGSSYNLQYDNNGNTISDNKGSYTYDLKNNMISSSRTIDGVAFTGSYTFNALSQRVAKNVGGQVRYFVYNENNQVVGEYDSSGNVINEYVYFGLRPVAVKNNNSLNIVHTDYLGTPRAITSGLNGGSMIWQWKNENPYGYNKANGSIEFNLRFAGQYYDSESGLHYNMFRTYNPELGRYMQSDPIGLAGGFNTYNYVGRNPISAIDSDGLFWQYAIPTAVGGIVGGTIGGVMSYNTKEGFWSGFKEGAFSGAVTGLGVSGAGRIIGLVLGEGAITQVGANVAGSLVGEVARQKVYDSCEEINTNNLFLAAFSGALLSPVSKPYILGKQNVVSWAENGMSPDLNSGRWVMAGFNNLRNFSLSGIFARGYPKTNVIEGVVNGNNLSYPIGGSAQKWEIVKGIFGQRIIK